MKFKDNVDFWNCVTSYVKARAPKGAVSRELGDSKNVLNRATGSAEGIVDAAGEAVAAGQNGPTQGAGVGYGFRDDDLYGAMHLMNGQ